MLVENRLRGIFIWTLSVIYLSLFVVKLIISPEGIPMQVIIYYIALNLLLFAIGFYVLWQKSITSLWLNVTIIVIGLILSTIMIYFSKGIMGPYFPFLYLILLIFAAFNRGKILLYLTGTISLFVVGFCVYISEVKVNPFMKVDYILYLAILLVTIIVIRNYPLECLSCDNVNEEFIDKECYDCEKSNAKCNNKSNCSVVNYNKNN